MKRIIRLKYEATCADCGAYLPAGSEARYYGRGRTYGVHCHDKGGRALSPEQMENWCEGRIRSHYDPTGFYAADGTYLGKAGGRCEDAPCCGCCP